jgi:arylsulfatase A-like enzyme
MTPLPLRAALLLGLALVAGCGGDQPKAGTPSPPRAASYASDGTLDGGPPADLRRRDVLVICLDTVRADALDGRGLMPGLARWCKKAVRFSQATTAAPWTGPAIASLLTGLLPTGHGARDLSDSFRVVDAVPTLAEMLTGAGWQAAAYAGGGWVSVANGMLQGFSFATDSFSFAGEGRTILDIHRTWPKGRPWALFLHTYEAHDPYLGPPARRDRETPLPPAGLDPARLDATPDPAGSRELTRLFLLEAGARKPLFGDDESGPRMARVLRYLDGGVATDPEGPALVAAARAAYEEGVRRLDRALADYLEEADRAGLLANAIVVVTSDHGEAFGEHGTLHHGRSLREELLRVPLAIRAPGWPEGRVVDEPVSLLDVAPTILDLVGLPAADVDGRSLAAVVRGEAGRPCLAQEHRTQAETGTPGEAALASVRDARRKWVLSRDLRGDATTEQVFDLEKDPGERSPLPASEVEKAPEAFRAAVARMRASAR